MSRPALPFRAKFIWLVLTILVSMQARAQYPGRVTKDADNNTPTLRATAVYEWTGDLSKPTAGRIVPVAVWDGQEYQPGGLYLAQPAPLTVLTGTVYQLEQAGTIKGTFQVNTAEDLGGSWIGIGAIKVQTASLKPKPPMSKHPPEVVKDVDSDRPTLHRKDSASTNTTDNSQSQPSSGSSSTTTTSTTSSDSDRPTLHRRDSSDTSSSGPDSGNSGSAQTAPSDPDRPTLHKHTDKPAAGTDSTAPVTATANTDPDRPKLRHGKPEMPEGMVEPSKLEGMPKDMSQMVAISDARDREPHSYIYSWSDPADAAKMKSAMEDLARQTLSGGSSTIATSQKSVTSSTTKSTIRRKATPLPASSLPALEDEKFSAFELSYSGGATLVFSAKTTGGGDAMKYITLIAQPDFYGVPQVIFKQVTSDDRLDITPRMRLVDAVDTDADNRAELIFELQGKTGRQFAIYRVVNRHAVEAFSTQTP
ncbi:MAG TPA: hypothetical protein VHT24_15075 [Pseudacidobacterium sp.]|jgi:hypothetical protein|nr:hypothetical protein [Pseudacidobacterium sp.]